MVKLSVCLCHHIMHDKTHFPLAHMNSVYVFIRYLTALILLWKLNDKVLLVSPSIRGQKVAQYLKSGNYTVLDV